MTGKRHFTVVVNGKEHGIYTGSSPSSAARKVVTKMCKKSKGKNVEFHLREMTQGSDKKVYGPYKGHIEKLSKPIELKGREIKYKPVVKLIKKKGGDLTTVPPIVPTIPMSVVNQDLIVQKQLENFLATAMVDDIESVLDYTVRRNLNGVKKFQFSNFPSADRLKDKLREYYKMKLNKYNTGGKMNYEDLVGTIQDLQSWATSNPSVQEYKLEVFSPYMVKLYDELGNSEELYREFFTGTKNDENKIFNELTEGGTKQVGEIIFKKEGNNLKVQYPGDILRGALKGQFYTVPGWNIMNYNNQNKRILSNLQRIAQKPNATKNEISKAIANAKQYYGQITNSTNTPTSWRVAQKTEREIGPLLRQLAQKL